MEYYQDKNTEEIVITSMEPGGNFDLDDFIKMIPRIPIPNNVLLALPNVKPLEVIMAMHGQKIEPGKMVVLTFGGRDQVKAVFFTNATPNGKKYALSRGVNDYIQYLKEKKEKGEYDEERSQESDAKRFR